MKLRKRAFTGSVSDEVTLRETQNRLLARRAAAEGFVLLKNNGGVLPIKKGSKIGLYGPGAIFTVKGGTGSGDVNERDSVNIFDGLKNAGYEITSKVWLDSYVDIYNTARMEWRDEILRKSVGKNSDFDFFNIYSTTKFVVPDMPSLDKAAAEADEADTAMYIIRRIAGEGKDRLAEEGDYYISTDEKRLLSDVCKCYKNVVLVINTGGLMDLTFVDEFSNINAIIQFVQAGQEGGNALADIISGDVTPSGKMTDTWAMDYKDYPNSSYFSYLSGDVYREDYKEGIYVGYRYFDTFDVPVRYCFGYGMSYTSFDVVPGKISVTELKTNKPRVNVAADVTNTGDTYSGKEVVQIYVSCPQGKMKKEFRRLAGFGKTSLLEPGEKQTLEISFPLYQLASYCEKTASWVLEGGKYGIWVGNSLDSSVLAGVIELDDDAVMVKCKNICPIKETFDELEPDVEALKQREQRWHVEAEKLQKISISASDIITEEIVNSEIPTEFSGKAGEIVNSLSLEQLINLATGDPDKGQGSVVGSAARTVPGAAAETVTIEEEPWNIAGIVLADGPAGLRLNRSYQINNGIIEKGGFKEALEGGFFSDRKEKAGETRYQFCTAIPVGTLLAQTWNPELVSEVGEMIGHEMELFEVTLWLAPGMNIHRNPLCGRNFEYYSEDPLVSGIMASAMTLGVQRVPGCGTTIKHFACNSQEDNRMGSDSVITERALREIYLKGFEIAVKNSQPMSIMTSYNLVNGVHTANSYDLCTVAARDEWGFAGAIMTDWYTTIKKVNGVCNAAGCMRAGNDMVMPGKSDDHDSIRSEIQDGTLSINELKRCIYNTINIVLSSNQYEGAESYLNKFDGLNTYMTVK